MTNLPDPPCDPPPKVRGRVTFNRPRKWNKRRLKRDGELAALMYVLGLQTGLRGDRSEETTVRVNSGPYALGYSVGMRRREDSDVALR